MNAHGTKKAVLYDQFHYIHAPSHNHNAYDVMESKYPNIDSLKGKFITSTYGHNSGGYKVFNSPQEFAKYLDTVPPADRVFHEVIFDQPQKLKFDIDAPVEKLSGWKRPEYGDDDPTYAIEGGSRIERSVELMPPTASNEPDIDDELACILDDIMSTQMEELYVRSDVCGDNGGSIRVDTLAETYDHILNTIRDAIREAFFMRFGFDIGPENEIICTSKGPGEVIKYSNHIIIDGYYVSGPSQAKEFTRDVASFLPKAYHTFLDVTVNKSIQNFRIVGCHKSGDDRTKFADDGVNILQTMVSYIADCKQLADITGQSHSTTPPPAYQSPMHPDDIARALAIVGKLDDMSGPNPAYSFRQARGRLLTFDRVRPSDCEICNEVHHHDNAMTIYMHIENNIVTIYKQCRQYTIKYSRTKSIKLGEFESAVNTVNNVISAATAPTMSAMVPSSWADRYVKKVIDAPIPAPMPTLFDTIAHIHRFSAPTLEPFPFAKTLCVHAAMKMGKTKALRQYMETYFGSVLAPSTIRFVSFRQTFSSNIKSGFPDFTMYNEVKGPLSQRRLIIQVESLWRLDITAEVPDLLILDECESIFEQFDSGLLRGNFNDCFAKFQYLLRHSKYVVCMDAGLSDRTFRILQKMRDVVINPITYYHCTYQNASADKYYICGEKARWYGALYTCIDADERVAVPISSLAEARTLCANLTLRYPTKKIKLYSSELKPSERKEHFGDVNKYWAQYDVMIYTPTISAGVSFEAKHFHKIFGYFTDLSCPIETCIQMIGRIRDVASREFYICLQATGNNQPDTIEAVKRALFNRRANLAAQFDNTGLTVEYAADGTMTIHSNDYFHIWLENTRMKNLSKNSFIARFIEHIQHTGASTVWMSNAYVTECSGLEGADLDEFTDTIMNEHKSMRSTIAAAICTQIAAANEINAAEAEEIATLKSARTDITDEQIHAYEKYRIRADYAYDGPIDEKFVARYHDPGVRRMFKNISRLEGATCMQIQTEELAVHKYLMNTDQCADLNRRYVFDQHRYALGFLRLCGWDHLADVRFIHSRVLSENIMRGGIYWNNITTACVEFAIRAPSIVRAQSIRGTHSQYIAYLLKPINTIIMTMYGVKIIADRNDPEMYQLQMNRLFTRSHETSIAKHRPMIHGPAPTVNLG